MEDRREAARVGAGGGGEGWGVNTGKQRSSRRFPSSQEGGHKLPSHDLEVQRHRAVTEEVEEDAQHESSINKEMLDIVVRNSCRTCLWTGWEGAKDDRDPLRRWKPRRKGRELEVLGTVHAVENSRGRWPSPSFGTACIQLMASESAATGGADGRVCAKETIRD